ncbi:MAG: 4Fe-4S dicluster domain-containing protein [Thermoleophilia bacterium]|nr:4Fe-4S dicluster domain-containing protein [Thermoleophilia bacterium]
MANEGMDRRSFLKLGGLIAAASAAMPASQLLVTSTMASSGSSKNSIQYAMTVDLNKCDGCKVCEQACREENNVPDLEAYYGEDAKRYTPFWLRVAEMKQEINGAETEERPIVLLCQHCEKPPCVHVCPTQASFRREKDGIVLIDEHRCIGCRYCVIACPYRMRTIVFRENPIPPEDQNTKVPAMMNGVATKCTFCAHKDLEGGEKPACVEKCPMGALKFGNRMERREDVTRMIADGQTLTLRPNLEVGPNVFYLGLSKNEGAIEKVLG